jgi:hypothetical protein
MRESQPHFPVQGLYTHLFHSQYVAILGGAGGMLDFIDLRKPTQMSVAVARRFREPGYN